MKRTFTAYGFELEGGQKLPEMSLAFETYGRLAPDGRNGVLITHGFTVSHHAAGTYSPSDPTAGWWNGLIGPGSRTDKVFPPSIAPAVMDKLAKAGVDATYFEIDTDFGHAASGADWPK